MFIRDSACTSHKIEARDLYNLVLKDIQELAAQAMNCLLYTSAASFDIISTKSGQVFGDHAAELPRLNVSDHALEGRAVEVAASISCLLYTSLP